MDIKPKGLTRLAEKYFIRCENDEEPITVSGLALALGLTSSELIELAGEDRAAALALARVEKAYEILIARSGKAAESFALRLLTRDPVRKSGGAEILLGEGLEEYGG